MAKRPKPVPQMTTAQFEARFPVGDEEACQRYLIARRWPQGVHCPRCGNADLYDASSYKPFHWQCRECAPDGYRFSCLAGTIFENTKKPLRDWYRGRPFDARQQEGNERPPNSTHDGLRQLRDGPFHVPQNPRGADRARSKSLAASSRLTKRGSAAKTRTAIGTSATARAAWGRGKTPIIGAVERQGNVVARVLSRVTSQAMLDFVNETVSNKVSLLATNSWPGYSDYLRQYPHATVDHHAKQYVVGAVHTNTIEGFWSIFKRGVVGTFHKMSAKYMPLYVAEFQFRYNNRFNPDMFGTAIAGC